VTGASWRKGLERTGEAALRVVPVEELPLRTSHGLLEVEEVEASEAVEEMEKVRSRRGC